MRVLVDTSAWVDFFNGHPSREAAALAELLEGDDDACTCGIVATEVLQGLRRDVPRRHIEALIGRMILLEPHGLPTYVRAADLFRGLRARGVTVRSTIDCIIAVLAEEAGASLLAKDRDIDAILESGLVRVARWPLR